MPLRCCNVSLFCLAFVFAALRFQDYGHAAEAGAASDVQVTGPVTKDGIETYVVTSDYQEKPCNLYVLLPDHFDTGKQYKVLYVLPAWAPSVDGIREMKKLDLANRYQLICVGPDFSGMPWYVDNEVNSKIRNDSYVPDVIVPLIDKLYPTIARPQGRLLIGYSKAGMGAVSLLLRHPDVFGRAGSWDGILMMQNRPEFYGSNDHFAKYFIPNLIGERAAMLKDHPARIAITGFGDLKRDNDECHALLDKLGIPHFFDNSVKRRHEWTSGWVAPLVQVLMADDMAKLSGTSLFAVADEKPATQKPNGEKDRAKPPADPKAVEIDAFCEAAALGKTAVVLDYLKKGMSPNVRQSDGPGKTPLIRAIMFRHLDTVKALLDNGADIHFQDNYGRYPVYFTHLSNVEIMQFILDHGGIKEISVYCSSTEKQPHGNGKHLLGSVCAYGMGSPEMIAVLVKAGANPNQMYEKETPLIAAIALNNAQMTDAKRPAYVRALIESGADVNLKDAKGLSPLHWAMEKGNQGVIEILKKAGAK